MKQFLRKIFFWDEPAKGAFFWLTAMLALPWLGLTLWEWKSLKFDDFSIGLVGLFIARYALFVLFLQCWSGRRRGLEMMNKGPKAPLFSLRRTYFFLPITLLVLCIILAFIGISEIAESLFAIIFLIDLTLIPGARKREWLALFALLLGGVIVFSMVFVHSVMPFVLIIDKLHDGPYPLVQSHTYPVLTALRDGLRISNGGWGVVTAFSLLCFLFFYLLQGKIIARQAGVPLRCLFGRRVRCLLGICAAIYAVSLPCAISAEGRYRRTLRDLEAHFGRPLAVAELEQAYCGSQQPNDAFWTELKQIATRCVKHWNNWNTGIYASSADAYSSPFGRMSLRSEWEAEPYEKWRASFVGRPEIERLDTLLDGPIPPARRDYAEWHLLNDCGAWRFEDKEVLRQTFFLQLWQLRFASEAHDATAVARYMGHLEKIYAYVKGDDFALFYEMEMLRLTAALLVIENGMADEAWLDSQTAYLERLEAEVVSLERRELYRQAVVFTSIVHSLAHCLDEAEHDRAGADFSSLRWFFPQAWWKTAYLAEAQAKRFQLDSSVQEPKKDARLFLWLLEDNVPKALRTSKCLLATIRCGNGLWEAERIRRQTGHFPSQMTGLLQDPFTGKPLQYAVGPYEIHVRAVKEAEAEKCNGYGLDCECACGCDATDGCRCAENETRLPVAFSFETRTIDAVQIYSPGPKEDSIYDDLRYFIRKQEIDRR